MGNKYDKLKARVLSIPNDLTFAEMQSFLKHLGYEEQSKGKTSGSRVAFFRDKDKSTILLHKPHPQKEIKEYAIRQVIEALKRNGEI